MASDEGMDGEKKGCFIKLGDAIRCEPVSEAVGCEDMWGITD